MLTTISGVHMTVSTEKAPVDDRKSTGRAIVTVDKKDLLAKIFPKADK